MTKRGYNYCKKTDSNSKALLVDMTSISQFGGERVHINPIDIALSSSAEEVSSACGKGN